MKHLLIDFENIQPQNLDQLAPADWHVWLFLGPNHRTLPVPLVKSLLRFGDRSHLVQLQRPGKNALDFYLSYYLGQISVGDPQAQINILARDSGYDLLVEHILANQQAASIVRLTNLDQVQREGAAPALAAVPPPLASAPPEAVARPTLAIYFQATLVALRQPDCFRPRQLNNLRANLRKYVLADLLADGSEEERDRTINNVINKLKTMKLIDVNEREEVAYQLGANDLLQIIQRHVLAVRPKNYDTSTGLCKAAPMPLPCPSARTMCKSLLTA